MTVTERIRPDDALGVSEADIAPPRTCPLTPTEIKER